MERDGLLHVVIFLLVCVVSLQSWYMFNKSNDGHYPDNNSAILSFKKDSLQKFYDKNPFEQMQRFQREVDKLLNSTSSVFSMDPEYKDFFSHMTISPSLNIKNFKDRYEVSVEMPEMNEENLRISAIDNVLSVEATTQRKSDENGSSFIKKERYEGSFQRSTTLPMDANTDTFESTYDKGVLKIIIPKKTT